jgi:transporter family-2 protein
MVHFYEIAAESVMNASVAMACAAGAGMCIALQAAANSRLRQASGEPLWATYFSILGTLVFSSLAMLALRPGLPTMESLRTSEWWNWVGGPLGALIVMSGTFLVPHLGAAKFIAFVVAGQLLASLVLDHFGLMGLSLDAITPGKVGGAVLVVAGVSCIKFL